MIRGVVYTSWFVPHLFGSLFVVIHYGSGIFEYGVSKRKDDSWFGLDFCFVLWLRKPVADVSRGKVSNRKGFNGLFGYIIWCVAATAFRWLIIPVCAAWTYCFLKSLCGKTDSLGSLRFGCLQCYHKIIVQLVFYFSGTFSSLLFPIYGKMTTCSNVCRNVSEWVNFILLLILVYIPFVEYWCTLTTCTLSLHLHLNQGNQLCHFAGSYLKIVKMAEMP